MNTLTSGFPKPFPGSRANGRAINAGVGRPNIQLRDDGYFQYPAQQVNRNQPRPFAPGFRASDTNSHPHRDLSAFGGLTNQSVFQTSHNDYSAGQVGSSGFPPLPHLFAPNNFPSAAAPSFIQDNSLQMQNWDVFGLNNDAGFGLLELNFNTTNDTVGANPLFIEGDADLPEDDDEGTISAPLSDSSPS
jgi:hypothetical protein